jgi:protein SCO1/2
MTPQQKKLLLPLIILAIGFVSLVGVALFIVSQPAEQRATANIGGPFQLVDQNGARVTEANYKGGPSIIFFGFTFCPDVCPTTLDTLGRTLDLLGRDKDKVRIIFVSVDPGRDTPEKVGAYLANPAFPKGVVGLTGTPEQVAVVARAYKVFYQKEGEGDAYLINHSSISYLMDPSGRFARVLPYGMSPEDLAGQIRDAMKRG